jgi:hypothetical protein
MPSWVMRQIEKDCEVRVASFHEGAWDNHQDVVILQKRAIHEPYS